MYSVYVLHSKKENKLYIGFTANLKRRIEDHSKGKVNVTRNWLPLVFIYAELYTNKKDALQRERFFKTGWGRQYLNKILVNTLKNFSSSKI